MTIRWSGRCAVDSSAEDLELHDRIQAGQILSAHVERPTPHAPTKASSKVSMMYDPTSDQKSAGRFLDPESPRNGHLRGYGTKDREVSRAESVGLRTCR